MTATEYDVQPTEGGEVYAGHDGGRVQVQVIDADGAAMVLLTAREARQLAVALLQISDEMEG